MSTLTGVIKAATRLGISVTPTESDLWVDVGFLYISSTLYPIEFEDAITPSIVEPDFEWHGWPVEEVHVGLLPPRIYRRSLVKYWDYKNTPPESIGIGLLAPTISRKTAVRYLTYSNTEPETIGVGLLPPTIFRKKVADYLEYEIPEESISVGLLAPIIKRTNT